MPGFLTTLFDTTEDAIGVTMDQPTVAIGADGAQPTDQGGSPAHQAGETPSGVATTGGSSSETDTTTVTAHQGLSLDVDVSVGVGGSYGTADGGTTDWSHTNDIGAHADTSTLVEAMTTLSADGESGVF